MNGIQAGFFTAFLSTFAPAALISVVRDNIGLTGEDISNAGALTC